MAADSNDTRRDVVVKIDGEDNETNNNGEGGKFWRESSDNFWHGDQKDKNGKPTGGDDGSFDFMHRRNDKTAEPDPPSKLINQFLDKQKAAGDEISLDMEPNMPELQSNTATSVVSGSASPATATAGYRNETVDAVRRRHNRVTLSPSVKESDSSEEDENRVDESEVVKCSSNRSLRTKTLMKMKTRSRLMDPPTPSYPEMVSGRTPKSGHLKTGKNTKPGTPVQGMDLEEEEDPFSEEDFPEGYRRDKLCLGIIMEWIFLILIIAGLICSLVIPFLRGKKLWNLALWKWEVMVLVLICGRLVSSWIVKIFVFFVERNFMLRKRVLYFVYGIRKPVQNCLWLGLVLIAWHFLFDKKVEREANTTVLKYVTKVLVCLLVAVIIWLIKTLLVKVLASSFHMSTYFDRIQESLFTQYVIETLSGPPRVVIEEKVGNGMCGAKASPPGPKTVSSSSPQVTIGSGRLQKSPTKVGKSPALSRCGSKKEGGEDEGIRIDHLQRMNTKNVSAWKMKRLMNVIRKGTLSTLDEQIDTSTHGDDKATQIRSEFEAKLAARKIFQNVAEPCSRYIYIEDFMRFLTEDESERAMDLFEGASESHKISKSCLKNWVVNAFRERRALALTLNDTKTAVNRLHRIINVLVSIVIVIIWLLILGIATTKFLLVISSQLLLVVFVFGNSCKTIFEAVIFVFVMHPFDVGDRCEIDGVQMIVEEMNILTTVFLRYDNQKIVYPNSLLGTKPIANYYRSPDMQDAIEFFVHIATPHEKITALKQRILSYVDNKKDHWHPSPMMVFRDMCGLNSVKIAMWPTHKMNHQDMGERFVRRGQLLEEIGKSCRELDIEYRLYPLNINVKSIPPAATPITSDRIPLTWTQQRNG
ncbi:mechanosensitive ion channel protein 4 [Raphanus sativus]|uniref:Mechanosensitive ion channel protein n=1 Tax=Raphanus sativus TaxID=3726 RepID=A0A6J0KI51_RAPSA|nr:mechanosensitive ion channel protein 4 [Raphanus sativus]